MHHIGISYRMSMSSKVNHYTHSPSFQAIQVIYDDSSVFRHTTWTASQPLNGLRRAQFHDVSCLPGEPTAANGFGIVDPHTPSCCKF